MISIVKNNKSLELFIFLVAMLLVVTISARSPLDADVWWHIRSGQTTLESGSPLMVDPFSFTRNGAPWTNHSWLAQVILFLAFNFGGYLGLGIFTAVLAVISIKGLSGHFLFCCQCLNLDSQTTDVFTCLIYWPLYRSACISAITKTSFVVDSSSLLDLV
jgi:hypothetical protein